MYTISATDLARNTREVLDQVAQRGQAVAVERNHMLIATIHPAEQTMTAAQALVGLPQPMLTTEQAASWLQNSQEGFDEAVRDPWA